MSDDMDDELDDFDGDERMRAEILRRARTEGIRVAFESALEICQDKKQPAVARASSQRTLLMVGGLLDRNDRNASAEKDPSEMDGAELQRATNDALRKRRALTGKSAGTGSGGNGAFD
ncbi:hypothetical protein [Mesorhizobium sp. LNHC209A00]|uniref:hypothetical protein n=1 Tax=Mesorhizobium TaxID=68287 RepID=UPI0003D04C80|nr:hypothetical protein [Mesorhizobium sp. LNHC209A00]ESY92701.1 hypothetical protein X738_26745 [Mesorhizobium sp. LNHC209A00]